MSVNIETTPAAIPTADWNATPLTVRQRVLALLEQVEHLQHRVAELEERLNQNSRNSSKPPSSDLHGTPLRPSRHPPVTKPVGHREVATLSHKKARRTCKNILKFGSGTLDVRGCERRGAYQ